MTGVSSGDLFKLRRQMQVVFQDPYNALSPRMTVERIVGEGLALHFPNLTGGQRRDAIVAMLEELVAKYGAALEAEKAAEAWMDRDDAARALGRALPARHR